MNKDTLVIWGERASTAVPVLGVAACVAMVALDHPHRAVLTLVVVLFLMAVLRLALPGRPWFASRNRWLDAAVMSAVGVLIWYFSAYTATVGLG